MNDNLIPLEVDLHGRHPGDIPDLVDYWIDHAIKTNYKTIHLIHGRGKGALRDAVRRHITNHEFVDDFSDGGVLVGGGGVTIMVLNLE